MDDSPQRDEKDSWQGHTDEKEALARALLKPHRAAVSEDYLPCYNSSVALPRSPSSRSTDSKPAGYATGHNTSADSLSSEATAHEDELRSPIPAKARFFEPKPLRERTFLSHLCSISDYVLTALPLLFLVLCIMAAKLHEEPIESHKFLAEQVQKAMRLGPTIFPLLFAAILCQTLKSAAHFLAERGTSLGNLELIMASQSAWGSIETQFSLRHINYVGILLLIFWALSPLGGQASLRLLSVSDFAAISRLPARYLDTGCGSFIRTIFDYPELSQWGAVNAIYIASLISTEKVKLSTLDGWNNVKIPRIEALEPHSAPDPEGWITVKPATTPESFSSLVGIPVVGVHQGLTFASYRLQTTYMVVTCPPMEIMEIWAKHWHNFTGQLFSPESEGASRGSPFSSKNRSYSFFLDTKLINGDTSRSLGNWARINMESATPLSEAQRKDPTLPLQRNLVFGTMLGSGGHVGISNCIIGQSHVEALVECRPGETCGVSKIRRSRANNPPQRFSPLESPVISEKLLSSLRSAAGHQSVVTSSATEYFLRDPMTSPYAPAKNILSNRFEKYLNLSQVPGDVLGPRLSLILNTYYQISTAPLMYTAKLPTDLSAYGPPDVTGEFKGFSSKELGAFWVTPMVTKSTIVTGKVLVQMYVANWLWISLLVVCSSMLFLLSILGLIVKTRSNAPDILGYVSSMTYHNPYITLPEGAAPLDGKERARALKHLKVQIADVQPKAESGRVALVGIGSRDGLDLGPPSDGIRKLERRRTYQ